MTLLLILACVAVAACALATHRRRTALAVPEPAPTVGEQTEPITELRRKPVTSTATGATDRLPTAAAEPAPIDGPDQPERLTAAHQ